jgi:hypothetical protein
MIIASILSGSVVAQGAAEATEPAKAEKKDDASLEIGARIQGRIMAGQVDSKYAQNSDFDALDFNFRRIRLNAKFQGASWFGGVVDIKGENLLSAGHLSISSENVALVDTSTGTGSATSVIKSISLKDSRSAIQEANLWVKPGILDSKIYLGQFKIPFIREQMTSSSRLMLPERAYSSEALQQQDIGLLLEMHPLEAISKNLGKHLDLIASITNGDGSGHDGAGRKSVEADSSGEPIAPLLNWRIQINPFGGIMSGGQEKSWSDGKEIFTKEMKLSLGAAGAYTAASEFGGFSFAQAYAGHTFDATFSFVGIYANAEFTTFSGEAVPAGYTTYQGTVGYNIPVADFFIMPVVRYNALSEDMNGNGSIDSDENYAQIWFGVNLFAKRHDFKLQAFYQLVQEDSTKKDDVFYFQVQTNFGKKI